MLENIKELKSVASRLNETSDSLTEALTQINNKLSEMNIGLTVWLPGPPLTSRSIEKDRATLKDVYSVVIKEILGYCKTKTGLEPCGSKPYRGTRLLSRR